MSGDHRLDLLFACLLGFVAVYAIGPPCVIYRIQRFKARPTLLQFDLDNQPPPGTAGQFFRKNDQQLTALGFSRLDCLTLPDAVPNVKALLVMYCNRRTNDFALVTMLYGLNPDSQLVQMRSGYVEIVSRYQEDDLRVIQTNNVQMLGSFPEVSDSRTFRFPHIESLQRLLELHNVLVERERPAGRKYNRLDAEFDGDCIAWLQTVFFESYERQIKTGYLSYDATSGHYRPTVKGALLMTWRELWPIKQLLWEGARASSRRLEREIS